MEEKMQQPTMITGAEAVLHANLLTPTGQRLTPTGKISHAKTRVYTQRYRKEWEQMPDFKGWLTSVPFQPTRAYCMYCKKNLHAHRLSLLKHTCTMKHQRAALLHEAEEKKKAAARQIEHGDEIEAEEIEEIEAVEQVQTEMDENEEEIEYVVERLETDDELDESHMKDATEIVDGEGELEEEEEEDEENVSHMQMPSDEEDVKHVIKKIKIERVSSGEDALAEAMGHMQSEYLEETDNQGTVQMEMVVESEDQSNPEMHVMSILPDTDDCNRELVKETRENGRSIRRGENKLDRKSAKLLEECKQQGDSGIVVACQLPLLNTTYQINSSVAPTSNTIGVLQPVNTIPIAPAQSKTITLTSGGKTLTLTGGTFQPGTHYVLSKLKDKLPTLVMADKRPAIAANHPENTAKGVQINRDQAAVASTSHHNQKKTVKSPTLKKPHISTHVMDMSKGMPVGGLQVSLYKLMDGRWTFLNESNTSSNGRCVDLVDNMKVNFTAGRYKIHFDVDKYFTLRKIETMYPFIEIVFDAKNPAGHYHIPVLLSPFGYTTYRDSER